MAQTHTRRTLLAVGTFTAVSASLGEAIAADNDLRQLIGRHANLNAELNVACGWWDNHSPIYDPAKASLQEPMFETEEAALFAVCGHRCGTLSETRVKARYLADLLARSEMGERHLNILLNSMI